MGLLAILVVAMNGGPVVTLIAFPFLAIPHVGVARLAALTARGQDVVLSDVWRAYRQFGLPALGIGAAVTLAVAILASNVIVGATAGSLVGWAFATLAASGLVAIWVVSIPLWILLVDPDRADRSAWNRVRLAVLLVLAAPGRSTALALLFTIVLFISTVAFAALLTVAVAYTSLVAARCVLPLADRLEHWLTSRDAPEAAG